MDEGIFLNDLIVEVEEEKILEREVKQDAFPEIEKINNNLEDLVKEKNRQLKTFIIEDLIQNYINSKHDRNNITNTTDLQTVKKLNVYQQLKQNIYQKRQFVPVVEVDKLVFTETLQDKLPKQHDTQNTIHKSYKKWFNDFDTLKLNKQNLSVSDVEKERYKLFTSYNYSQQKKQQDATNLITDQDWYNFDDEGFARSIGQIYEVEKKQLINNGQQVFVKGFTKIASPKYQTPIQIKFNISEYTDYLNSLQMNQTIDCFYNGSVSQWKLTAKQKDNITLTKENSKETKPITLDLFGKKAFECLPIFKHYDYSKLFMSEYEIIIINDDTAKYNMEQFYNIIFPNYQQLFYIVLSMFQPRSYEQFELITQQLELYLSPYEDSSYDNLQMVKVLGQDMTPISSTTAPTGKQKPEPITPLYNPDMFQYDTILKEGFEQFEKNYKNAVKNAKPPKTVKGTEIEYKVSEDAIKTEYDGFTVLYDDKKNELQFPSDHIINSVPTHDFEQYSEQLDKLKKLVAQSKSDRDKKFDHLIAEDEYQTFLDLKGTTSSQIMVEHQKTQKHEFLEITDPNLDYEQLIQNNMDGIAGDTAPYTIMDNSHKREKDMLFHKLQLTYSKYIQHYFTIENAFGIEFQTRDMEMVLQYVSKNKTAQDLAKTLEQNRKTLQEFMKKKTNRQKLPELLQALKKLQLQYDYINIVQMTAFMGLLYMYKYQFFAKINVQQSISKFFTTESVRNFQRNRKDKDDNLFKKNSFEKFLSYLLYNAFSPYNQHIQQLSQETIFGDLTFHQRNQIKQIYDLIKRAETLQQQERLISQDKYINRFFGFLPPFNNKKIRGDILTFLLQKEYDLFIEKTYPIKHPLTENTISFEQYFNEDTNIRQLQEKNGMPMDGLRFLPIFFQTIQLSDFSKKAYRKISLSDTSKKGLIKDKTDKSDKTDKTKQTQTADYAFVDKEIKNYNDYFQKVFIQHSVMNAKQVEELQQKLTETPQNEEVVAQFIKQKLPYYFARLNNKKLTKEKEDIHDKTLSDNNKQKIQNYYQSEPINKFIENNMQRLKTEISTSYVALCRNYKAQPNENSSLRMLYHILLNIVLNKEKPEDKINFSGTDFKTVKHTVLIDFSVFVMTNLIQKLGYASDNLTDYRNEEIEKAKQEKMQIYQNIPKEAQMVLNKMIEMGLTDIDTIVQNYKQEKQGDDENNDFAVKEEQNEQEPEEANELPDVDYDEEDIDEIYEDYSNDRD